VVEIDQHDNPCLRRHTGKCDEADPNCDRHVEPEPQIIQRPPINANGSDSITTIVSVMDLKFR
jgi:hypothetical protein